MRNATPPSAASRKTTAPAKEGKRLPDQEAFLHLLDSALAAVSSAPRTVRVEMPIAPVDALQWLRAQQDAAKTYWLDRDRAFEMAGVGVADGVAGDVALPAQALLAQLRDPLSSSSPGLRYYGGMRFDAAAPFSARWTPFGAYRFVLPRFEILNRGGQSYFACNVSPKEAGPDANGRELHEIAEAMALLRLPTSQAPGRLPQVLDRRDTPVRTEWDRGVAGALDLIGKHELEKVVLARESELQLSDDLDPHVLLELLRIQADNAYLFYFQPKAETAFLGVTPERLYRCASGRVQSEALAGTRPRGASHASDDAFGQEMLADDKERREHQFVRDSISASFNALCKEVRTEPALSLVRLSGCQHLVCRYEGTLNEGRSDADLLSLLHPTPAVGGHPTTAALAAIRHIETFDRGWYAGPVGWVSLDSSEFALGIRSALVVGRAMYLYSGAGIVSGSRPDREWDELETKIGTFLRVLKSNDD